MADLLPHNMENRFPTKEGASSAIVLQRMPQQLEASGRRDDWTGVTDSTTRRMLQNRHAQRLWSSVTLPSLHEQ